MWPDPRDGSVYRALMNLRPVTKPSNVQLTSASALAVLTARTAFARPSHFLSQSNARPPPDQWRGKIEEIGVHCAIGAVEADYHRKNRRSDQHAVFGTAAWNQPAPDIALDHECDDDCRQGQ